MYFTSSFRGALYIILPETFVHLRNVFIGKQIVNFFFLINVLVLFCFFWHLRGQEFWLKKMKNMQIILTWQNIFISIFSKVSWFLSGSGCFILLHFTRLGLQGLNHETI